MSDRLRQLPPAGNVAQAAKLAVLYEGRDAMVTSALKVEGDEIHAVAAGKDGAVAVVVFEEALG